MQKFVIYTRLSKEDKKKTQHGFDSQIRDINFYLGGLDSHTIVGEFQEFVSGADDDRVMLEEALAMCREQKAVLLVAKLDRLSRKVSVISALMEDKTVNFRVATMPSADNFQLHIYAALAAQEREMISARVKAGLAAAKAKGKKLGAAADAYKVNPLNATKRNRVEAVKRTQHLREPIQLLVNTLVNPTYKNVAEALTDNNYKLPSGIVGEWKPIQAQRMVERLNIKR